MQNITQIYSDSTIPMILNSFQEMESITDFIFNFEEDKIDDWKQRLAFWCDWRIHEQRRNRKKKANFQIAIIWVCLFLWRIQFRFFEWIHIEKIHWKNWLKWNEIITFEQNQEVILFKLKTSHQKSSKSNKRDRNGFYRFLIQ